jgi:hypothetical protein
VGITPEQLKHFVSVIEPAVGKEKTDAVSAVVKEVLQSRSKK